MTHRKFSDDSLRAHGSLTPVSRERGNEGVRYLGKCSPSIVSTDGDKRMAADAASTIGGVL